MKTIYHCRADEFCPDQTETGGEYGVPLKIHCMVVGECMTPEKQCLYRKAKAKAIEKAMI